MRRIAAVVVFLAASTVHAQFRERIDVVRILVDVRVTDFSGNPIPGLTADDFDITVGGRRAVVESVEWIDDGGRASRPPDVGEQDARPPDGRLVILFVQTDFAREKLRIQGHLHFLQYAEELIEEFGPSDRVAVMQFDSHLKLRLDFTSDKDAILDALRDTYRIDHAPSPAVVPEPSLASRLDRTDMRRAADSETALLILGNALRSIRGPKTIVLLGWGLGKLSNGFVNMPKKYRATHEALDASRSTIFALDTTDADFHSLEIGLQRVAEDTGGFYAKTHLFAQNAVDRLHRTLSGHYEIELRRPDALDPGTHNLRVRVKRRGTTVLAPSTYIDRH